MFSDGVASQISNETPRVIIKLRAPEANKPEWMISIDGKRFVLPLSFTALRSHAEDVHKILMRFPVKEAPIE